MIFETGEEYVIDYTNWKGNRRERRIIYLETVFRIITFHGPDPGIYLRVIDDGAERFFDPKGIHTVKGIPGDKHDLSWLKK